MAKSQSQEFRQSVLDKFGCKCAYCGIDLTGSVFHLDHFIPRRRYNDTTLWYIQNGFQEKREKGSNKFENYMPCCPSCNSSKSDLNIEEFRDRVYDRLKRLNQHSGEYNIAKRFGLVIEVNKPVIFHFEKHENGNF